MTDLNQLARLLRLRQLREERARLNVVARMRAAADRATELLDAQQALSQHEQDTQARETKFFTALAMRPFSQSQLGRSQDRVLASDQRREALIEEKLSADKNKTAAHESLTAARAEWARKKAARDRLGTISGRLYAEETLREETAAELEDEETTELRKAVQ